MKVWEYSHELTLQVYKQTSAFPKDEIYGLTSQVRRAVASIPANIAEGCGKDSNLDLARFLQISLGSANEVEYFLLLAKDLNYLIEEVYIHLHEQINKIKAMLINLIQQVRAKKRSF